MTNKALTTEGMPVHIGRIYRTIDVNNTIVLPTFDTGSIVRVVNIYGTRVDCELIFGRVRMPHMRTKTGLYMMLECELEELNPED